MQHSLDLGSGAHKHGELVVLPEVGLALGLVVRFLWGMWGKNLRISLQTGTETTHNLDLQAMAYL